MKFSSCLIAVAVLLAGCGESRQASAPPPAKLFAPQREALDKTKGVEQTVNQQAEQQKQEAERQAE